MTHIEQRYDTAAAWASANPVLNAGEVGWETDTRKSKLGDGVTAWNSLLYTVGALTATKASLGLDQVNNTSDADKPPSTAVQAVLDAHTASLSSKAPLASPAFTGNPTAPTPAAGDNDTSVATTAFVTGALAAVPTTDVQIFRASGTWTKPAGAKYVLVRAIGGGGAGGGCDATAAGEVAFGAGGGGGGYAERRFAASALTATEAVIVGAGGLGASGTGGGAGGSSTFDTLAANGGSGGGRGSGVSGNALAIGGAGGAGTGDLVIAGSPGGNARGVATTNSYFGSVTGNSALGAGAADTSVTGNGNNAGANSGGGGSGGINFNGSATVRAGGNGGSGIVIVATYF